MSLGTKPVAKCVFLLLITNVIWVPDANAYLDPATGGMLVSALLGLFATVVFLLKTIQYKVKALVSRLFGTKLKDRERYSIIFYSEGRQYWSTFEPVLRALDADQIPCTYLTSGADDPGLSYRGENVRTRYIGEGYRAYALLNFLDADICVLTTPGLDVKQIKRSKSVKHYVHLVHSVADIGTYQQFSFDYFDTILTSSEHQIRALRELEKIRGTKAKRLLETGCTYMDLLQARVSTTDCSDDDNGTRVLIAPTWGANGLLSRFGATLPQTLLDAGYEVILRPHPQSYISEKETLDRLTDELTGYPNLTWDESTDAFESMRHPAAPAPVANASDA